MRKLLIIILFLPFWSEGQGVYSWNEATYRSSLNFIESDSDSVIFCYGDGSLYKSVDSGLIWDTIWEEPVYLPGKYVFDGLVYFIKNNDLNEFYLVKSDSSHAIFTETLMNCPSNFAGSSVEKHNGYLFARDSDNNIYRSSDDGINWNLIHTSLPSLPGQNGTSGNISFHSKNNYLFAFSSRSGMFVSENDGISFRNYNNGIDSVYTNNGFRVQQIKSTNDRIYALIGPTNSLHDLELYYLTIGDSVWTEELDSLHYTTEMATTQNNVFITNHINNFQYQISYKNQNQNWITTDTNIYGLRRLKSAGELVFLFGRTLAILDTSTNSVHLRDYGLRSTKVSHLNMHDSVMFANKAGNGIYYSYDTAKTWQAMDNELKYHTIFDSDYNLNYSVFATSNGIYYSNDLGQSLTHSINDLDGITVNSILFKDSLLIASTGDFVYKKKLTDLNWVIDASFPSNLYSNIIEIYDDTIFIGTDQGLYYYDSLDINWQLYLQNPIEENVLTFFKSNDTLAIGYDIEINSNWFENHYFISTNGGNSGTDILLNNFQTQWRMPTQALLINDIFLVGYNGPGIDRFNWDDNLLVSFPPNMISGAASNPYSFYYESSSNKLIVGSFHGISFAELTDSFILNHEEIIPQTENNFIKVFPNPFFNSITIETGCEILKVDVYSLEGKKIKEFQKTNSLDLSELSPGVYLINIQTINGFATARIVKK